MKHLQTPPPSEHALADALATAGIPVDAEHVSALARHAEFVYETNQSFNLTRITTAVEYIRLHVIDSLLPWQYVPVTSPVIDIGSGAGFPGIPLAIVYGGDVTLCESVTKKATFLERCVSDLSLACNVYPGRAEDLAREGAQAGLVTARAVTTLAALVELAAPLLRAEGRLVALKGSPSSVEIEQANRAARMCGMSPAEITRYALPSGGEHRTLLVYERVGEPRLALPRRTGLAQHSPLG